MSRRSGVLEFAVLGLLRQSPMHGYELRKRLNTSLGVFRAFSYGTLYPCLKTLVAQGWLAEEAGPGESLTAATLAGRRAKIVYRLTADGKEHFEDLLAQSGPDAWEDEQLRRPLRLLRSHRTRTCGCGSSKAAAAGWRSGWSGCAASLARTRERLDDYTLELQRHGLESVEREVRWLNELIETERTGRPRDPDRDAGRDREETDPRDTAK